MSDIVKSWSHSPSDGSDLSQKLCHVQAEEYSQIKRSTFHRIIVEKALS